MKQISTLLFIIIAIFFITAAVYANEPAFRQAGIASWYGNEFNGRPTASGEIFDDSLLTAAHPTLPFGTILTVTNTYNNRQVTVRVNDRGPFVAARIIDVSRAAAQVLDMIHTGTAPVFIESVVNTASAPPAQPPVIQAPATQPPATQAPATQAPATQAPATQTPVIQAPVIQAPVTQAPLPEAIPQETMPLASVSAPVAIAGAANIIGGIPAPGNGRIYRLQIGAYRIPRNAVDTFEKLQNAGLSPNYERAGDLYRVVITGLRSEEIPSAAEKIWAAGFSEAIIREEQ